MKKMNKFLSLLLAIVMVLSLAVTAIAADETQYTITIEGAEHADFVYEAYQIFGGTLKEENNTITLNHIVWGNSIRSEKLQNLVDALQAIEVDGQFPFAACESASDFAEVLGHNTQNDNAVATAFAEVIGAVEEGKDLLLYLHKPSEDSDYDATAKKHTLTVTGAGYYLIRNNKTPSTDDNQSYVPTRYMLEVVKSVNVSHKGTIPTVDKDILGYDYQRDGEGKLILDSEGKPIPKVDDEGNPILVRTDSNSAAIGDTITYEIEGTLPENIADYDSYYYAFFDTMSKGLSYVEGSLKITVNNKDVTPYFYKNVAVNESTGRTNIEVSILDLLALELLTEAEDGVTVGEINKNTKVILSYKAILDDDAWISPVDGNKNTVKLEFSRNPNVDGEGAVLPPPPNPDKPVPSVPVGETPYSEVITYTTELIIKKVDDDGKPLTGAAFRIEGTTLNRVITTGTVFVLNNSIPAGEDVYYKLDNNKLGEDTYTTTAPVFVDDDTTDDVDPVNSGEYDWDYIHTSTDAEGKTVYTVDTFALEDFEIIDYVKKDVVVESFVDENGQLKFTGLGEGEYTITETVIPKGYNPIDPFKVTITWKGGHNWEYTGTNAANSNEVTVVNRFGATLPSTGGMGTTIFYGLGSVLVLAAVVLLVSKKRMATAE